MPRAWRRTVTAGGQRVLPLQAGGLQAQTKLRWDSTPEANHAKSPSTVRPDDVHRELTMSHLARLLLLLPPPLQCPSPRTRVLHVGMHPVLPMLWMLRRWPRHPHG